LALSAVTSYFFLPHLHGSHGQQSQPLQQPATGFFAAVDGAGFEQPTRAEPNKKARVNTIKIFRMGSSG
jgi:hypothetical protein